MYPAMPNSPKTELAANIAADATTITVVDATKLPAAPNTLTILSGDTSETISYTTVSGNNLNGCVRGLNGTAKAWTAGVKVARTYTAYDHDTFIAQIKELSEKTTAASTQKAGIVQLSDALSSTDTSKAATANAVKKTGDAVTQALTDAKKYVDDKSWQKAKLTADNGEANTRNGVSMNTLNATGIYSGNNFTDTPDGSNGVFTVVVMLGPTGQDYVIQTAYKFSSDNGYSLFIRTRRDGGWYPWSKDLTGPASNIIFGDGNPEGVVVAIPGKLYVNRSGGTGTTFYVKESGTSNTGWRGK